MGEVRQADATTKRATLWRKLSLASKEDYSKSARRELQSEVAINPNVSVIIQLPQVVFRRSFCAPRLQIAVQFSKRDPTLASVPKPGRGD